MTLTRLQKAGARLWITGRLTEAEVTHYVQSNGLFGRDAEEVFEGFRLARERNAKDLTDLYPTRSVARPVFGKRGR